MCSLYAAVLPFAFSFVLLLRSISVSHWTCLNMWPLQLISYHIFFGGGHEERQKNFPASPRQRIWTRTEIYREKRSLSTKQIVLFSRLYLFCSSLPLRPCSQCASITQRLIFLSINQCKAPCVRHALWVSAWPEWIHIYSWEPIWNCLNFELAAHSIAVWFTESKGHRRRALSASFMHMFTCFPTGLFRNMAAWELFLAQTIKYSKKCVSSPGKTLHSSIFVPLTFIVSG